MRRVCNNNNNTRNKTMPVAEITFVGDKIEVYARIQTETKEVVDVYWDRKDTFPVTFANYEDGEVPSHDGKNPLFVHADNPKEALELARQHYHVSSKDEDELNTLTR